MNEVWGVAMVRDEEDVIEQNLRHLRAEGLDGVVVLDNRSEDETRPILDALAVETRGWLRVVTDPEPGYWQSTKMTSAMRFAESLGATWVIPFDADEIWYSETGAGLAETVRREGDEAAVQQAILLNHFATGDDPEIQAGVDDPFTRMRWRLSAPGVLAKVAVRAAATHKIDMGNHGASARGDTRLGSLRIRHFPYRSAEQMIRKVRNGAEAYASARGMGEAYGLHWKQMGATLDEHGPEAIRAWFYESFFYADPHAAGLVLDPAPLRVALA